MRHVVAQPMLGYHVVGFVDDDPEKAKTDIGRFRALGNTASIPRLIKEMVVDEVIITLPWMYHRKIVSIIAQCEREQIRVRIVPDMFQMTLSHLDVEDLGGIPMIGVRDISIGRTQRLAKPARSHPTAALFRSGGLADQARLGGAGLFHADPCGQG
jgi:FlaA1/EpsC-like NDP-sugar epimerase